MNSVFSNHDEESDEERVVYLDISDGAVADGVVVQESNRNNIINSSTTTGVKRKPLFQYRKYKGDVRNIIILLLMMMMVMMIMFYVYITLILLSSIVLLYSLIRSMISLLK